MTVLEIMNFLLPPAQCLHVTSSGVISIVKVLIHISKTSLIYDLCYVCLSDESIHNKKSTYICTKYLKIGGINVNYNIPI